MLVGKLTDRFLKVGEKKKRKFARVSYDSNPSVSFRNIHIETVQFTGIEFGQAFARCQKLTRSGGHESPGHCSHSGRKIGLILPRESQPLSRLSLFDQAGVGLIEGAGRPERRAPISPSIS